MKKDDQKAPQVIESIFRKMMLDNLKNTSTIDSYELELFAWYVQETEQLITGILSAEQKYIQEQIDAKAEDINDSGMVAVEYYLKRIRYSHVIYMTSLLESFLEQSCKKLTNIIGKQNMPFNVGDLRGDQWSVKRKFLERYGNFQIPKNIFSEINVLIFLRNNFVHDNGSTSELKNENKKEEKSMLDKQPWINLSGSEIVIEADYIYSAFETIKLLIQFVEARLVEIVDRAISPKIIS